jgi:hypothetical protein
MDDEALSWFVDNTWPSACWRARRGRRGRVGGVTREVRVALDPQAAGAGRHRGRCLAPAAPGAAGSAGGRTDLGGSEQSVRTIATVQTAAELARWTCRCPTAAACGWTRWPPSATPWPSRARRAAQRQAGGGLRDGPQPRAPAKWTWPPACAPRWPSCKAEHPDLELTEAFNFVDPVQENYDGSMCCCTKARCWPCWWCGCSCATGAPPWCLGRGAAAVGHSRPSSACTCWAFRSTSSRCWRCRWWSASWWTTPSSRSRTSCATCAWARRPTRRRWRRPTRSAWR